VFVIIEAGSRRVVNFGVTGHPTDRWIAQQLREATPFGEGPRFLIRDNDRKYGASFGRVAAGIDVLKTPLSASSFAQPGLFIAFDDATTLPDMNPD
jgi:hypothetical protein